MPISTLIASGSTPQVDDLWAIAYLFKAEWGTEILVTNEFRTTIEESLSDAEQRRGLRSTPQRTVSFGLLAHTREQIANLQSLSIRTGISRNLFPLASDISFLTAAATSTDTVLCDTADRRFSAGIRVVVFSPTSEPEIETWEIAEIYSLDGTSISMTENLTNNYPAGAGVIPLFEAGLILTSSGDILTDNTARMSIEALETTGKMLPVVNAIGTNPTSFPTHASLPILNVLPHYEEMGWGTSRKGSLLASGLGSIATAHGTRGSRTRSLPFIASTRAEAFALLRFFESRGGSLHPFWLPDPLTEFTATGVTGGGSGIVLTSVGLSYDWTFRPFLAIELNDGTTYVRGVDEVVRNAGQDTVTFDSSIGGLSLSDIRRVASAIKCRFASDEMKELWASNHVMRTAFDVIELTNEKSVTISNLVKLTSSDLATAHSIGNCEGFTVCSVNALSQGDLEVIHESNPDFTHDLFFIDAVTVGASVTLTWRGDTNEGNGNYGVVLLIIDSDSSCSISLHYTIYNSSDAVVNTVLTGVNVTSDLTIDTGEINGISVQGALTFDFDI